MLEVCKQEYAAQSLIDLDMVEVCIQKLDVKDHDDILVQIHALLRQLLLVENGTERFLEIPNGTGVTNICKFLKNPNPLVIFL